LGTTPTVRLGMIGTGGMGVDGHLSAYQQSPHVEIVAACDVNPQNLERAAQRYAIPATYLDYREMLAREALDAVDVVTPNDSHAQISLDALARKINVLCEKPLALNRQQAREMTAVARKSGVIAAVNFTYRNVPAARFIREIIQSGEIGDVYHVIATYNQGWLVDPASPRVWRLNKAMTGTGTLGDLGSHLIDLARWWVGEFRSVLGHLRTFVAERPLPDGTGLGPVDVDDAATIMAQFANGATGVLFATRYAFARANAQRAEIYGTKGGLVYDNERPNEIQFAMGGFMARSRHYCVMPVPGSILASATSTMQQFVEDVVNGISTTATFDDGAACQEVLDAVEEADRTGGWVSIPLG